MFRATVAPMMDKSKLIEGQEYDLSYEPGEMQPTKTSKSGKCLSNGTRKTLLKSIIAILIVGGIIAAIVVPIVLHYQKQTTVMTSGSGTIIVGGNGNGSLLNQLNEPRGFFVDDQSNIYIADSENHRIMKWLPGATAGVIVAGGNGWGQGQDQLSYPTDVWVDSNKTMYIADFRNKRVQRWINGAISGETIFSEVDGWNSGNYFEIHVDEVQQEIYVSDEKLGQIFKYTIENRTGILVAGGFGQGNGSRQFQNQRGFTVDHRGNIFVADTLNHRIQKWSALSSSADNISSVNVETVAGITGRSGSNLNQLYYPADIMLDSLNENMYIADYSNGRVMKWPASTADSKREGIVVLDRIIVGSFLTTMDRIQFDKNDNHIYILDRRNNRVIKATNSAQNLYKSALLLPIVFCFHIIIKFTTT